MQWQREKWKKRRSKQTKRDGNTHGDGHTLGACTAREMAMSKFGAPSDRKLASWERSRGDEPISVEPDETQRSDTKAVTRCWLVSNDDAPVMPRWIAGNL